MYVHSIHMEKQIETRNATFTNILVSVHSEKRKFRTWSYIYELLLLQLILALFFEDDRFSLVIFYWKTDYVNNLKEFLEFTGFLAGMIRETSVNYSSIFE